MKVCGWYVSSNHDKALVILIYPHSTHINFKKCKITTIPIPRVLLEKGIIPTLMLTLESLINPKNIA